MIVVQTAHAGAAAEEDGADGGEAGGDAAGGEFEEGPDGGGLVVVGEVLGDHRADLGGADEGEGAHPDIASRVRR